MKKNNVSKKKIVSKKVRTLSRISLAGLGSVSAATIYATFKSGAVLTGVSLVGFPIPTFFAASFGLFFMAPVFEKLTKLSLADAKSEDLLESDLVAMLKEIKHD